MSLMILLNVIAKKTTICDGLPAIYCWKLFRKSFQSHTAGTTEQCSHLFALFAVFDDFKEMNCSSYALIAQCELFALFVISEKKSCSLFAMLGANKRTANTLVRISLVPATRHFWPRRLPIQRPGINELGLRFKKGYYNRPQTVAEIKRRPIATIQRVSTARKENLVKRCIGNPKHRVRQDRFYSKLSAARIRLPKFNSDIPPKCLSY